MFDHHPSLAAHHLEVEEFDANHDHSDGLDGSAVLGGGLPRPQGCVRDGGRRAAVWKTFYDLNDLPSSRPGEPECVRQPHPLSLRSALPSDRAVKAACRGERARCQISEVPFESGLSPMRRLVSGEALKRTTARFQKMRGAWSLRLPSVEPDPATPPGRESWTGWC